jgi:hypothetical protein
MMEFIGMRRGMKEMRGETGRRQMSLNWKTENRSEGSRPRCKGVAQ